MDRRLFLKSLFGAAVVGSVGYYMPMKHRYSSEQVDDLAGRYDVSSQEMRQMIEDTKPRVAFKAAIIGGFFGAVLAPLVLKRAKRNDEDSNGPGNTQG